MLKKKEKIGSLPIIIKQGYTFNGWYTAKTGGGKITSDIVSKYTSDFTVYAQYIKNTTTVTFDACGGTGTPATITADIGTSIILPDVIPTLQCKTFVGWSLQNGGNVQYKPGEKYTGGDTILYALWISEHAFDSNCTATLLSVQNEICNYSYKCNLCGSTGTFTKSIKEATVNIHLVAAPGQASGTYEVTADLSSYSAVKELTLTFNYSTDLSYHSISSLSSIEEYISVDNKDNTITVKITSNNGISRSS